MARAGLDWSNMLIALVMGVVLGLGVSFIALRFGMPTTWIGPVTGGLVGGLVPAIYRLRTQQR